MLMMGVDLSASSKKSSPLAFMDERGNLNGIASFKSEEELQDAIDEHRPTLVAIDAPLSLPLGLCCLEEDCDCAPTRNQKGRASEQELASMGIGCFFTAKRSIIRNMIYRAMTIRRNIEQRGYPVIEVYPYATKVILFDNRLPPKNDPACLPFLKGELANLVPGSGPYLDDLNHDRCDALLTAHTAYLHHRGQTDNLGLVEEGLITVPTLPEGRVITRRKKGAKSVAA